MNINIKTKWHIYNLIDITTKSFSDRFLCALIPERSLNLNPLFFFLYLFFRDNKKGNAFLRQKGIGFFIVYHKLGSVHWHPGYPQVASAPLETIERE